LPDGPEFEIEQSKHQNEKAILCITKAMNDVGELLNKDNKRMIKLT
jgi:hypothetical protein